MALQEDQVREALKQVIDPELFVNIVDLGLIYVVDVLPIEGETEKYNVKIDMTMTSPMCPAGPQLVAETKKYAGEIESVENVEVKVVMDPPWTQDMTIEADRDELGIFWLIVAFGSIKVAFSNEDQKRFFLSQTKNP